MKIKLMYFLVGVLINCYFLNGQQVSDSLYLNPTKYIDCDNISIVNKTNELTSDCGSEECKIKAIFEYIRDSYTDTIFTSWIASEILKLGGNSCHQRSILLVALCRTAGIPARLHWQKVKIHDFEFPDAQVDDLEFIHGITGVKLNNNWYLYEPVGNKAKWQVWVQRDDSVTVDFVYKKDCLFQDTDKIQLKTLPIYFSDYFEEMVPVKEKILKNEVNFSY